MLLPQADEYAQYQAGERTERRDKPSFEQEDPTYHGFVCAHMRENADVFALVDDEHRE